MTPKDLLNAEFVRATAHLEPASGKDGAVVPARYPEAKRWDRASKTIVDTPFIWANDRDGNHTVVLSSWAAEAHAMAAGLDDAGVFVPQLVVDFGAHAYTESLGLRKLGSRQLSHRYASAEIRDSLLGDESFAESATGKAILAARPESDCRALYQHDPFSILCGAWNSHSKVSPERAPKFGRTIVAGVRAHDTKPYFAAPVKTDPLRIGVEIDMDRLGYANRLDKKPKKPKSPSTYGYGSVTQEEGPKESAITMSHASFTWVLSLQAVRDLRFGDWNREQADAARAVLTSLALVMLSRRFERGFRLRSSCDLAVVRCSLVRLDRATIGAEPPEPSPLALTSGEAEALLNEALHSAQKLDAGWADRDIVLEPDPKWLKAILDEAERLRP